jgi:hypothetical protein
LFGMRQAQYPSVLIWLNRDFILIRLKWRFPGDSGSNFSDYFHLWISGHLRRISLLLDVKSLIIPSSILSLTICCWSALYGATFGIDLQILIIQNFLAEREGSLGQSLGCRQTDSVSWRRFVTVQMHSCWRQIRSLKAGSPWSWLQKRDNSERFT